MNDTTENIKAINSDNLNDQFTTYEIASKLKALGFTDKCVYYFENKKHIIKNGSHYGCTNSLIHPDYVAAPLWQQAINWLREKYQVIIEIQLDQTSDIKFCIEITKWHGFAEFERINIPQQIWGMYRNYYKAQEVAILKVLELINNGDIKQNEG